MKKLLFIILALILNTSNVQAEDIDIYTAVANLKYDEMETFVKDIDLSKVKQTLEQKDKVKAVPNFTNEFFIRVAIYAKDPEIIKYIVNEAKAEINYSNKEKKTPLMYSASYNNNSETTESLISLGANVNASSQYGLTSLMYASINDKLDNVKVLLANGADINAKDSDGITPLMRALANNHLDIARYLIEAGADVTVKDKDGNTALVYLLDRDEKVDAPDIVQMMIDGGVDVNASKCQIPLEYAHVCGLKETEKLLVKAGAKAKSSFDRLERIGLNCEKYSQITCTIWY